MTCPQKETSLVPSGCERDASPACSQRNYLPHSCCWDAASFLSCFKLFISCVFYYEDGDSKFISVLVTAYQMIHIFTNKKTSHLIAYTNLLNPSCATVKKNNRNSSLVDKLKIMIGTMLSTWHPFRNKIYLFTATPVTFLYSHQEAEKWWAYKYRNTTFTCITHALQVLDKGVLGEKH